MKTINICAFVMVITVVAFIGFCVENIWLAFSKGYMDNRNMILPFLLGYGIAMLLVYVLFGLPHQPMFFGLEINIENPILRNLYYYVMMVICISVGEIALGMVVEKICGYQWWNYTRIPLHITQYTSIPTSMGFAAIVFVVMRYGFDWLMSFFLKQNETFLKISACFWSITLTADMVYNLYLMYKNKKGTVRWTIKIREKGKP